MSKSHHEEKKKVGMISLGCPKNQVDAEIMLSKISEKYEIVDDAFEADAVIVNTCGFIADAKQEAIDTILEMTELKGEGSVKHVVVTGCLAERYRDEIKKEIPEVDAVVGIGANKDIGDILDRVFEEEEVSEYPPKKELPLEGERILTTPPYTAYIKISEGCSNCCTYCAIPSIRGHFRSRTIESIVEEAKTLAENGVKELVVVAQDTTRYGEDLYGENRLCDLLKELCKIESLVWIRLLYCYPDRITDELLETIAENEKILNYIDLPLQHCNGKILSAMNRTGDRESLTALINKIREKIPDVVIRTTFITGFPGEGEEEFEDLAEFINEIEFERLGCFAYSAEEGTKAAELPDQVDEDVKKHRAELIMQDQYGIVECKNNECIGKTLDVLVEGYDGYTDSYYGRSYMDAPDVDASVSFTSKEELNDGDFVKVKIFDVSDYDLIGEAL